MVVLELQENGKIQEMSTIDNVYSNNNQIENNTVSNDNNKIISWSLYIIFQIVGLLLILFVFLWLQIFRGGYGFFETRQICNWHPLLMTIAFNYLFANSILHFRNFHHTTKRVLKFQHTIIFGCIVVVALFGLWAGLKSNSIAVPYVPQFYSLHSWLGILTCMVFFFQFINGFVSFLYPGIARRYKEIIMPYHIFFGTMTFTLSVITSVLGFCEKNIFAMDKQTSMSVEGMFINFVGLVLIFYGVWVVYLLINPKYKGSLEPESVPVVINNEASN